ncbi:hypothetical protein DM02DRAFT_652896 [Periconia macrospinosa]|uniref:Uncharacterized protein n=1 Tax=Periconia macrospinosa TaxID=97972 RepID=A0A2V1E0D6_9PLEO|nr:hypothetical protein DM02DRAFT_652896 [Periconia macrospinosa]
MLSLYRQISYKRAQVDDDAGPAPARSHQPRAPAGPLGLSKVAGHDQHAISHARLEFDAVFAQVAANKACSTREKHAFLAAWRPAHHYGAWRRPQVVAQVASCSQTASSCWQVASPASPTFPTLPARGRNRSICSASATTSHLSLRNKDARYAPGCVTSNGVQDSTSVDDSDLREHVVDASWCEDGDDGRLGCEVTPLREDFVSELERFGV